MVAALFLAETPFGGPVATAGPPARPAWCRSRPGGVASQLPTLSRSSKAASSRAAPRRRRRWGAATGGGSCCRMPAQSCAGGSWP
jgi:hypothetical protein